MRKSPYEVLQAYVVSSVIHTHLTTERWSCASFWWSPCRYQASTNLLPRAIHSWSTCWDPTAWYWWLCFCFGMFCCSSMFYSQCVSTRCYSLLIYTLLGFFVDVWDLGVNQKLPWKNRQKNKNTTRILHPGFGKRVESFAALQQLACLTGGTFALSGSTVKGLCDAFSSVSSTITTGSKWVLADEEARQKPWIFYMDLRKIHDWAVFGKRAQKVV